MNYVSLFSVFLFFQNFLAMFSCFFFIATFSLVRSVRYTVLPMCQTCQTYFDVEQYLKPAAARVSHYVTSPVELNVCHSSNRNRRTKLIFPYIDYIWHNQYLS